MVFNSGLLSSEIKGNWGVLEDPMSPGSMYSHSIYLKLNNAIAVQDFRYFQAQVYTIRVHGPLGTGRFRHTTKTVKESKKT